MPSSALTLPEMGRCHLVWPAVQSVNGQTLLARVRLTSGQDTGQDRYALLKKQQKNNHAFLSIREFELVGALSPVNHRGLITSWLIDKRRRPTGSGMKIQR